MNDSKKTKAQLIDELVYIAINDYIQPVEGQPDAMIGDPVLRIVVGTDFFAALARTHLQAALFTPLGHLPLLLGFI